MAEKKVIKTSEHESVHFYSNYKTGLETIMAVHTTFSGVSLGGLRIKDFSTSGEALEDALKLSRHMTYKSLLCDLNIGGGKSVIRVKKGFKKTRAFFESFAEAVNSLGGQYIVSIDMGSDIEDMRTIKQFSPYVIGYSEEEGGAGDPGPFTAHGVLKAMKTASEKLWSSPSLKGKKICVIGIGDVGGPLCGMLLKEGAELLISDINLEKLQPIKNEAQIVDPAKAPFVECDILSPCAFGGLLTKERAEKMKCRMIAGAANNQLADPEAGPILHQKGICYLPDFAINSGGLVGMVMRGLRKKSIKEVYEKIDRIAGIISLILQESKEKKKPESLVALNMAHERYKKVYSKTIIR